MPWQKNAYEWLNLVIINYVYEEGVRQQGGDTVIDQWIVMS